MRIWNLNGQQTGAPFYFGTNYQNTVRWKNINEKNDEDASDISLSVYYRKYCNASFSSDDLSVVATGYTLDQDSINNKKTGYNQVLYYDAKSNFYYLPFNVFSDFLNFENKKTIPEVFNHIIISPSCRLAAGVNTGKHEVNLLAPDGLRLVTFEGNDAMFSGDGENIFMINGNRISKFPVDIKQIKNYLNKFKISRSVTTDHEQRMVL
jgi:hypothetical protein